MTTMTTGTVTSADGTAIGFRRLGQGPAVVFLHGAMESGASHLQLAEQLSDVFTVILPDRRGRGLSGPYAEGDGLDTEVEDLGAVLAATGAHQALGVSSGAIIALRAALTVPGLERVAAFEPPLPGHPSFRPAEWMPLFDRQIAEGKVEAALVTAMLGTQMGPPVMARVPRRLLEFLTRAMVAAGERKAGPEDVTMRMLAPTFRYDGRLAVDMTGRIEEFRDVRADVLLLGGARSPAYLKAALDALEGVLPKAERAEFPKLDHGATGNRDQRGRPDRVAPVLRRFFA